MVFQTPKNESAAMEMKKSASAFVFALTALLSTFAPLSFSSAQSTGQLAGTAICKTDFSSCSGPNSMAVISPASVQTIPGRSGVVPCCAIGYKRLTTGYEPGGERVFTCVYISAGFQQNGGLCSTLGLSD